ncbi:hypothetical protein BDR05DRAFT_1005596 [Suillus weaverae]|nr:hypothetical protein BDR05DRAFT_1005596 [Suillus weaverae]
MYNTTHFYRFARASPALHGVDTSVTPASDKEATLTRTALNLAPTTRMFKVGVPWDPAVKDSGWLTLIIPQPVAKGYLLVGHWTRMCPALDILNKKVVMFKDSWHVLIKDQNTQTVKFRNAEWACPNQAVTPHTLHRLVLKIVGEKLTDLESSPQLIQSVHDALVAHHDAFANTKILHRDLSIGNIIIYEGRRSSLIGT